MTARDLYFREILARWMLGLVAIVALPALVLELPRPWRELQELVRAANGFLAAGSSAVSSQDMALLNALGLQVLEQEIPEDQRVAHARALDLLLSDSGLPAQEQLERERTRRSIEESADDILSAAQNWQGLLLSAESARPGTMRALKSARQELLQARENLEGTGFDIDDIYVMLDHGPSAGGFFQENTIFIVGSHAWWDQPVYPGMPYHFDPGDSDFWRASYLPERGGSPDGYHHNPYFHPILPVFDRDEWGTWFSTWRVIEPEPGRYNVWTVDFEASRVMDLMVQVAITALGAILAVSLIVALSARYLAARVSRPIDALRKGAEAVVSQDYDHIVPPVGKGEFVGLIETFNDMTTGLKERVNLLRTIEKLLSKELAEIAARQGLVLGGQEVDVTIMFTDFAGFSTLTRDMKAVEVVEALNSYFSVLIPIIKRHGGFPDKYIGDAIVALFGAPVHFEDHAERALACAIALQKEIRVLNERRRAAGMTVFEMRVGLNSGNVVVGAIGCDDKLEYTSIGETTNLANRMEAACDIGHVALAEACYDRISEKRFTDVTFSEPTLVQVKGYPEPVSTHQVWIDDFEIIKNMQAESPSGFYVFRKVTRPRPPGLRPPPGRTLA